MNGSFVYFTYACLYTRARIHTPTYAYMHTDQTHTHTHTYTRTYGHKYVIYSYIQPFAIVAKTAGS